MYYRGVHGVVSKDIKKASEHFLIAASKGRTPAMNLLGQVFERGGEGVEVDLRRSIEYRNAAALRGHASALHWLATQYCTSLRDGTFEAYFPDDAAKERQMRTRCRLYLYL